MNCETFRPRLSELVLNPAAGSNAEALEHLETCSPCGEEYTSLVETMSLMDAWIAPDPSPYFDQKLAVLLREEVALPKMGFFARLREHLLFNTGRQFRPAVAGALVLVLTLGGGGYVGFENRNLSGGHGQISATVNDLQTLDKNEQTLKQIDQLIQDDDSAEDGGSNAPS